MEWKGIESRSGDFVLSMERISLYGRNWLCIAIVCTLFAASGCTTSATRSNTASIVRVTKPESCSCCKPWVKYLEANGFKVEVTELADLAATKKSLGIPDHLKSCHTAEVAGYVIEGHVSASDIRVLLAKRPKILGLVVPGMPAGAPGEPGGDVKPYDVLALRADGGTYIFAHHDPAHEDAAESAESSQ
jgi:hypothetical protein